MSATEIFFEIPELVLLALGFLSTTDLVQATRISKMFQQMILEEAQFKQTLFLQPAGPLAYFRAPRPVANDARRPRSPTYYEETRPFITNDSDTPRCEFVVGALNPMFSEEYRGGSDRDLAIGISLWLKDLFHRTDRIGSTWNNMFLSQPPATEVLLIYNITVEREGASYTESHLHSQRQHTVRCDGGVRIIDIVQAFRAKIAEYEKEHHWEGWNVRAGMVFVELTGIVDECCPYVRAALEEGKTEGFQAGSDLVSVQTGRVRDIPRSAYYG